MLRRRETVIHLVIGLVLLTILSIAGYYYAVWVLEPYEVIKKENEVVLLYRTAVGAFCLLLTIFLIGAVGYIAINIGERVQNGFLDLLRAKKNESSKNV